MDPDTPDDAPLPMPAWLRPWLIPVLLVMLVVSAVNLLVMLGVAVVVLGAVARWRYQIVRERERDGGPEEWERWRTEAMFRRASERYNPRR